MSAGPVQSVIGGILPPIVHPLVPAGLTGANRLDPSVMTADALGGGGLLLALIGVIIASVALAYAVNAEPKNSSGTTPTVPGQKGEPGQSVTGAKGEVGDTGAKGDAGAKGEKGDTGSFVSSATALLTESEGANVTVTGNIIDDTLSNIVSTNFEVSISGSATVGPAMLCEINVNTELSTDRVVVSAYDELDQSLTPALFIVPGLTATDPGELWTQFDLPDGSAIRGSAMFHGQLITF